MPCNECVCRRPVGRRSARVAPAEPQHQAAGRYHPEPAGGEFAVEAARPAQVQIVVELVDPGPQGKGAGRSVLLQIAARLTCVRVHEHGQRVSGADPRHPAQQHPCRRPLLRWGPNRADLALGVGLAGRVHLLRHRQFAGARGGPAAHRRTGPSRPGTNPRTAAPSWPRRAGTGRRAGPRRSVRDAPRGGGGVIRLRADAYVESGPAGSAAITSRPSARSLSRA